MLLEDQLPRIQKLIKEKLGPLPKNALQNKTVMKGAFRRLYQTLPRMIRLAFSEQGFVEFCMANRERLLNLGDAVSDNFSSIDFSVQLRKARASIIKTDFLFIFDIFYSILIILFLRSQQFIVNNSF